MKLCEVILCVLVVTDFAFCKYTNQYKGKRYWTKSPGVLRINVKIHFDLPLIEKLMKIYSVRTRYLAKGLAAELLEDVEKYFQHPSLNQTVKFKLLDTKFLRGDVDLLEQNVSNYLMNYCRWQETKKSAGKVWYYSILLTGLDVYYVNERGRKIMKSTARSYMKSICSKSKSCAILEWHPKNNAYLLAHEIAHGIGLHHDGLPHNICHSSKYIMSSQYNAKRIPTSWSSCSKRELEKILSSKRMWCLRINN